MPIAVNQSGKALRLEGERWIPTDIAENESGERIAFDGQAWVPLGEPAKPVGTLEAIARGAGERVVGMGTNLANTAIRGVLGTSTPVPDRPPEREPMFPGLDFKVPQVPRLDLTSETRETNPIATRFGEFVGDFAALIGLRRPFKPAFALRGQKGAVLSEKAAGMPAGIRRQLREIMESSASRAFGRGMGRVGEAGMEGAMLAALDEGDPLITGGVAAGTQAIGSMSHQALSGLFTKTGLIVGAGAGLVVWQMVKEMTPGGRDRILESSEQVARKLGFLMAAGAVTTMAGSARVSGSNSLMNNMPVLADALTAFPRTGIISMVKDFTKDEVRGGNVLDSVMTTLSQNPQAFTNEELAQLSEVMTSDRSLLDTIDAMMEKSPKFRGKIARLGLSGSQPGNAALKPSLEAFGPAVP
jgi:hypothetical protein